MSKIYEALLRAEQERAAEVPHSGHRPFEIGDFRVQANQLRSNDLSPEAEEVTGDVSTDIPLLVNSQLWQPSLDQLPALNARGSKLEQFRSLGSQLTGIRNAHPMKSIFIGSALPGEGKSYVAANLAIVLARHRTARVLLIDGDLRQGTLHKVFGCPNQPGLAEFLNGKNNFKDVLQRGKAAEPDDKLPQGLRSLTLCASGNAADRAAELTVGSKFSQLLESLAPNFDWIIVDSSPVNLVSDGVNLARACDGALLVVRGGVTKFETAQRALHELKAAKVLGVVLNAVEDAPDVGKYGYHGYHSSEDQGGSGQEQ